MTQDWRESFDFTVKMLIENPAASTEGPLPGWQKLVPGLIPSEIRESFFEFVQAHEKFHQAVEKLDDVTVARRTSTKHKKVAHAARIKAIIWFMRAGDLRPLADAVAEGCALTPEVGRALAGLIDEGRWRVALASGWRGAPEKQNLRARNLALVLAYAAVYERLGRSDEAFAEVAANFKVSESTVRNAVTQRSKPRKSQNRDTQRKPI